MNNQSRYSFDMLKIDYEGTDHFEVKNDVFARTTLNFLLLEGTTAIASYDINLYVEKDGSFVTDTNINVTDADQPSFPNTWSVLGDLKTMIEGNKDCINTIKQISADLQEERLCA